MSPDTTSTVILGSGGSAGSCSRTFTSLIVLVSLGQVVNLTLTVIPAGALALIPASILTPLLTLASFLGGFPVPSNTTAEVKAYVDTITSSVTDLTLWGLPDIRNSSTDVRASDLLKHWDGHHELATIADSTSATGQYAAANESSRVVEVW